MITFKKHLNQEKTNIIYTLLLIIIIGFFYYVYNDISKLFPGFYAFFLLSILPLFIHIDYYLKNKNSTLEIDFENSFLVFNNHKVYFQNIKEIRYYSQVLDRKDSYNFWLYSDFEFVEIVTIDNKKIVITSLLLKRLDDTMKRIAKDRLVYYFRFLPFTN